MNILYIIATKSAPDFALALIDEGHNVSIIPDVFPDPIHSDESHRPMIHEYINNLKPDCVISFLFIPMVSEITHSYGIPYISWTYDSPLASLFCEELKNDNNYAFIFDKRQYDRLKIFSPTTVYHLPLAANIARIGAVNITDEELSAYSSDISFVGGLYQTNSYNAYYNRLDELTRSELKQYLLSHINKWDSVTPWPSLSDHAVDNITSVLSAKSWNNTNLSDNTFLGILFLSKKLAEIDRITLLNALAEHHHVDLYTSTPDNPALVNVHSHGKVDYNTDMNKIFYSSKINLNITLPSIESGIPQRVFDIMACGGFCLSNYQEEIDDLFIIGKHLEVFHSTEELLDKTDYYLKHENERLRIAINGYKLIKEKHTTQHRVRSMLKMLKK